MKKVKSIVFELELEGQGIVNNDSTEQQNIFWADYNENKVNNKDASMHRLLNDVQNGKSNFNFAKKTFFKDEKGRLDYKIKISSDCLRNAIFSKSAVAYIGNIVHNPYVKFSFIGSHMGLSRGYLTTNGKDAESHKRKSTFTLTDAIQTNNAVSSMETFSKSGQKSETSLFKKETIGEITYKSKGFIDLAQTQFISLDPLFDRKSFDSDEMPYFNQFYKMNFNKKTDANLGYFLLNNSAIEIPEYGVKLDEDSVLENVKYVLKNIFNLSINRTKAYCRVKELKIKLITDAIGDSINDNWLILKSEKDIDKLKFEVEDFYVSAPEDLRIEYRDIVEKELLEKQNLKKATAKEKSKSKAKKNEVSED